LDIKSESTRIQEHVDKGYDHAGLNLTPTSDFDNLSDVRDGLSRKERIVLYCIDQIQKERGGRDVPTVMLYGRVVEYVNISEQELQFILQRLTSFNQ
jgi:hypothetical protein